MASDDKGVILSMNHDALYSDNSNVLNLKDRSKA